MKNLSTRIAALEAEKEIEAEKIAPPDSVMIVPAGLPEPDEAERKRRADLVAAARIEQGIPTGFILVTWQPPEAL